MAIIKNMIFFLGLTLMGCTAEYAYNPPVVYKEPYNGQSLAIESPSYNSQEEVINPIIAVNPIVPDIVYPYPQAIYAPYYYHWDGSRYYWTSPRYNGRVYGHFFHKGKR